MGKIKSKAIKRTAKNLLAKNVKFTEKFEENKKILGKTMPSKKIRNQLAGLLSRIKKQKN
jgi:ribosomal protein S17E